MIAFFKTILVILLLTVVALASAVITMHFAIHGAEVAIPDFRGLSVAASAQRAAALGLSLNVESRLYSADVPAGLVKAQAPAAGAIVRRGWRVWLTESLGPRKMAIPDVAGKDQRIATIEMRRAGLQTGIVAVMPWTAGGGADEPGTVIAQSPQPNAAGADRPVVNLLVKEAGADESSTQGFVMPNLEGEIFTTAALSLTHMGLRLAPVQEQDVHVAAPAADGAAPAPLIPPGSVIAQNPPAGFRVDSSMPVQLTVAK